MRGDIVSICLALLVPFVVPSASRGRSAEAAERLPNLVVIVADDLGYGDLGSYGSRVTRTPHLDRLAEQGVRATSFYVTWPACTPSRGSLLTGRYPQRNGLYDMIRNDMVNYKHHFTEEEYAVSPEMTLGLDEREITFAQQLKAAGYATGVVGKWDSGRARRYLPLQRGFDFFYGFANTGIDYWTHERYGIASMFRGNQRIVDEGYATELFSREALQFVRDNQQRPFLLYLPFNAPHGASNFTNDNFQVPESYLKQYPDLDPAANRTKYLAMVTCMDEAIGGLLALLEELQLADHTLVMFLSDNGGAGIADNGPLRGRKAQMFEDGLRVPLIARWPGRIPPGKVTGEQLTSLEVFPTLLAAAAIDLPANPDGSNIVMDGFDMLPVLTGRSGSLRKEMFWQRRSDKAARVGNFKWVESAAGSGLFDLSKDIGEQHDLSAADPDRLARLQARFQAWRQEMEDAEPRGPFRDY
jgi:arylsulfatase A